MLKISRILLTILSYGLFACGGGSSESGVLVEGTLTEGGGASHSLIALQKNTLSRAKHGVGENIENVQICALGECSTTDGEGQWGFALGKDFEGGEVLFTIDGHGIDTATIVNLPHGANEVFIHFSHVAGGLVEVHHMTVEGQSEHSHDAGDDHTTHTH